MPFNTDLAEKALNDKPRGFNAAAAEAALSAPSSRGFNTQAAEAALATPAPAPSPAPPPAAQPQGKNPFQQVGDAVGGWMHQQGLESAQARKRAAAIQDPFAPEKALLRPAAAPAGAVLGTLDRGRQAVQAGLSGHFGDIPGALWSGLPEAKQATNRNAIKGALAHGFNPTNKPDDPARDNPVQHFLRPAMDKISEPVSNFAIDTATDPFTYLGGAGVLEQGYRHAAKHALPAVLKGADKAGQAYVKVGRKLGGDVGAGNAQHTVDTLGHIASGAYKAAVPGGVLKLGAARDFREKGDTIANRMFSAKNAGRAQMNAMQSAFSRELHDALKDVTPEEEMQLYYALHFGKEADLPDHLKPVAKRMSDLTDSPAYLMADRELKAHMTQGAMKKVTPSGFPIVRYEREGSTGAGSRLRGGRSFTIGHDSETYKGGEFGGMEGGSKRISGYANPKNPLVLKPVSFGAAVTSGGEQALKQLAPPDIQKLMSLAGRDNVGAQKMILEKVGVTGKEADDIISRGGFHAVFDRAGSELAKKAGHDAIVLHPQSNIGNTDPESEYIALDHAFQPEQERTETVGGGFVLPEYAKPFDNGTRSLMRKSQYRKNYVPTRNDAQLSEFDASPEEISFLNGGMDNEGKGVTDALTLRAEKKAPQASVDRTDTYDPNLERRQGEGVLAETPEEQRAIFEQRLHSAARAIAGRDTGRRATSLFNSANPSYKLNLGPGNVKDVEAKAGSFAGLPPYVREFFTDKFTPEADKSWQGKAADIGLKGVNNAHKSAMFISPVRHIMNIATLGTLADPSVGGALQTAKTFAKIVGASPEKRYKELKDAIDSGAVGVPSADRVTSETAKGGISKVLSDMTMKTPIVSHAINGVRKVYTMSGDILWSFDDASKATRFRRLLAKGEHPADAAAQTNAELIDYTNKSDFTNLLSYLAPFATYRSKLPGAIARNVVQHPERALTVNRAAPALAGGYQQGGTGPDGRPQGLHSNLPLAEVMRGADDPEGYLRSTLGALPKAIGSMGSVFDSDQYPHYLTYGKEINNIGDVAKSALANALGNIPGVEQAESMYGLSQYPNKGLQGAISGQLGLSLGRIPTMESAVQKDMEAERKKGHHPTRAQVIKYLERHPGG